MEKTTLRLNCKEKMSSAVIKNPVYIPRNGDRIHIQNIFLSQPILAEEKLIPQITYQVTNERYNVWFDQKTNETFIDIRVNYIDEISEEALKKNNGVNAWHTIKHIG
jgi:hypothetical protein